MGCLARFAPLPVLAFLAACAGPGSVDDAEKEVAAFHRQLDAKDYASIWRNTSNDMRASANEKKLTALLDAVNRKLGKVKTSRQSGWQANMKTNGSFVQLVMQTSFERGDGVETFIYRKVGEDLKLSGYNINSEALIIN